jgi:isocitrate dehydrogenase
MFLETFYNVAKEYPGLRVDDVIVDDLAMKLVVTPDVFDVIVLPNLQGDIISDLCAGLVGGLGMAPSANIGDNISIFEAVHGTAPDITGTHVYQNDVISVKAKIWRIQPPCSCLAS